MKRKSSQVGVMIIILIAVLSLLAHWVAPDKSFNANDGSEFLTKKPPLFSVQMLKVRDDNDNIRSSFLHTLLYGKASAYSYIPINEAPQVFNDTVFFKIYPPYIDIELKLPLIDVTESLYPDFSRKLSYDLSIKNHYYTADSVFFLNVQEQILVRSKEEMLNDFHENYIINRTYYLGTDENGRDLLSRILYATRLSMLACTAAALVAILAGILIAILIYIQKYSRFINYFFEMFKPLPVLLSIFLIAYLIQPENLVQLVICIAFGLTYKIMVDIYSKIERISQIPHIRELLHLGFSRKKIFLTHIFPRVLTYLSLVFISTLSDCFIYETFLSFVNLSLPHYMPSIGNLINNGLEIIETSVWHIIFFPVLMLIVILFGFNIIIEHLKTRSNSQSTHF